MNVSSVKNLNGEVFSAVQDATLTDVVQTNSSNWDNVTNKLDTTSFADVSGSFLTAVDLSNYYTKSQTSGADELAQAFSDIPLGDEAVNSAVHELSGTWNEVSSKLDTTAFGNVSGTFLTAHQPISAEEWNGCYDNVNTNSGAWGGSALPISAGPGVKLQLVNNTLVFSNDETLLWSGAVPKDSGTITLSENFNNFEKIGVSFSDDGPDFNYQEFPCSSTSQHIVLFGQDCHWEDGAGGWCLYMKWASFSFDSNGTTMTLECAGYNNIYGSNKGTSTASYAWAKPYKIVGINRK